MTAYYIIDFTQNSQPEIS